MVKQKRKKRAKTENTSPQDELPADADWQKRLQALCNELKILAGIAVTDKKSSKETLRADTAWQKTLQTLCDELEICEPWEGTQTVC